MKKRILSILLVAVLVCAVTPMEAFAANEASGNMSVSYTYSPAYVINIPASVSINDSNTVVFSASEMDIGSNKMVTIAVDGDRTYENGGNFYLYKDKGTETEERISCIVYRGIPNMTSYFTAITGLSEVVAKFFDGNTSPAASGAMKFEPEVNDSTPYGTYTGTVYFKIELTDKQL